jgi:hypothetical protein
MDGHRVLRERMIEGKKAMRKRLSGLTFSEKIKILERLRERELAVAAAGLRRKPSNATELMGSGKAEN